MADLIEAETYEPGIYQLEITDPVIGGPSGIDNLQPKQLANRTKWLKAKVDSILSMSFINSATAENPGGTDAFGYWDSFTQTLRRVSLTNLIATFRTSLDAVYAVLNSPAFTGAPTAPTAAMGTATTQVATTDFVKVNGMKLRFVAGYAGSVALTDTHLNGLVYSDTGTNVFQLPNAAITPIGATINIYALSATITVTSIAANIYAGSNGGVNNILIYKGASTSFVCNGSSWIQLSSSRNIGEGQNWSDVSGSRAKDTIYTNTTGMPINVSISIGFNATSTQVYFQVNGVRIAEMLSDASKQHSITFIVPNGQTYAVSSITGTSVITRWAELR